MSLRTDILAVLQADGQLNTSLPGGVYDAAEVGEISRQSTEDAFDENKEPKNCALMRLETETPTGPYPTSSRLFLIVNFYGDANDDARERVFALLNMTKIGTNVWEIRHVDDVLDQTDDALGVSLALSRYQVTRLR
ncbi:hypothetical protein ANRL1_03960 [Anaerolineae bacterium]|nr:hypothetical protein ANRL1_03960 [Anaerolineae bacterium]